MCGIAGILDLKGKRKISRAKLEAMVRLLRNRGPDGKGVWTSPGVGLGHARLAIIDVSKRGAQPMKTPEEDAVVSFNGEIYNFQEIRAGLQAKGHVFKSKTDTEVILHAYREKGIDCVKDFAGMFAFALWDAKRRRLVIARDRIGEKPLYYGEFGGFLYFSSEILPILEASGCKREIDLEALHHFFTHNYYMVPAPMTIFKGIRKLPPAHVMVVEKGKVKITRYWKVAFGPKRKEKEQELARECRQVLGRAVSQCMISDVPLGLTLSGGVDSSSVFALMNKAGMRNIQCFTIGFGDKDPEIERARSVSKLFPSRLHEIMVQAQDLSNYKQILLHQGEPIILLPLLYSLQMARKMREKVTVALTGNGGDEIFGGYDYYNDVLLISYLVRLERFIPKAALYFAEKALALASRVHPVFSKLRVGVKLLQTKPERRKGETFRMEGERIRKRLYSKGVAEALAAVDVGKVMDDAFMEADTGDYFEKVLHADLVVGNAPSIIIAGDLPGMINGLESRNPFLDHRVIEFVARLPKRLRVRSLLDKTYNKYILKKSMEGVLPGDVLYAKKMGFGFGSKWREWLRTIWRDEIQDVLFKRSLAKTGLFDMQEVRRMFDNYVQGKGNDVDGRLILSLAFFELWHEMYIEKKPVEKVRFFDRPLSRGRAL